MQAMQIRLVILNVVGFIISAALAGMALIEQLFEGLLGAVRDELAAMRSGAMPVRKF